MSPLTDRRGAGVAVLGAAHIHLDDAAGVLRSHPDVRVRHLWDHDTERAERWADAVGAHPCADLDSAVETADVTGVLIYSETSRHGELMTAAAERGLAVFVEKPLAASLVEAEAIPAALLARARPWSTGFFVRYGDAFVRLREMVRGGAAGDVRRASVRVVHGGLDAGWFDRDYRWMREPAEGGGGFFDLVVHCLDLVTWVFGPFGRVVDVRLSPRGHHGTAVLRTASGVDVDVEAGWEAPAPAIEMVVAGTTSVLTARGADLFDGATLVATGRPPGAGDAPRAWLDTLVGRRSRPLVMWDDARDCVVTVDVLRRRAAASRRGR